MTDTTTKETRPGRHAKRDDKTPETPELRKLKRRIGLKHSVFETGDFLLLILQSATVLLAVFASIPFILQLFMGVQFNTVLSGSMTPTAKVGDLIITQPYLGQQLTVGTIIGIEDGSTRYTHRIVAIENEATGNPQYVTQGDANNTKDLFRPTSKHVWGVATNIIHQPMAYTLTLFSWNTQWFESMGKALSGGDWTVVGQLLPAAPWGLILLIMAVLFFWWLIPDLLALVQSKQAKKDELAMALLKRQVEWHEENLTAHEVAIEEELKPTITELRPVVEEYQHERKEKAEAQARALEAEEQVWGMFGNVSEETPVYDEADWNAPSPSSSDDLSDLQPAVEATIALPDLDVRPTSTTRANRVDEITERLMASRPSTGPIKRPALPFPVSTPRPSAFDLEED